MSKEPIKYKGIIRQLWTGPVWSKVISAGIIAFIVFLYSLLQTLLKDVSLTKVFIDTINYKIELWQFFVIVFVVLILFAIYYKWRQRKNKKVGKFNTEEVAGNFTFRELHNSLLTHKIDLPISLRSQEFGNQLDLMTLFVLFQRQLNIGVSWDQPGDQGMFLYQDLGPTLMSYGLTEKAPEKNKADALGLDIIQTSAVGQKYLSMVEKWRIYNDEKLVDDPSKTKPLTFKKDD
jgi:hypothetical protein